eukprot:1317856-Pleurochrysis_carterae.AAC.1
MVALDTDQAVFKCRDSVQARAAFSLGARRLQRRVADSQNFRQPANVTSCPICHWECDDRMAPPTRHSPSNN